MNMNVNMVRLGGVKSLILASQLESVVKTAAFSVEAEAKHFAPVDKGNLRASIHTEKIGPLVYKVCTNIHYAIYQEYGTSKMKAHPYMRPAVAMVKKKMPKVFKTEIRLA